jgi:hypothetical protein
MTRNTVLSSIAAALCFSAFTASAGDFNANSFGDIRPGFGDRAIIIVGGHNPGDAVSLNPQPLPPKSYFRRPNIGDEVSLNPQPLPPRSYRFRR